jgi:hypothetical protein
MCFSKVEFHELRASRPPAVSEKMSSGLLPSPRTMSPICVQVKTWFTWQSNFFFLVSCGGVRLSPLGTSATIWPIVPALDDRWWVWSNRWNENWQEKQKYSEKTSPSTTLSTTNPTWSDLGSNLGRRGGKPANNRLSYSAATWQSITYSCHFRSYENVAKTFHTSSVQNRLNVCFIILVARQRKSTQ